MASMAEPEPAIEAGPRRALMWGGGLLVAGLGLVGVGQPDEGSVIAVAGAAITVYGIHRFGRLGPIDQALEAREEASGAAARGATSDALWMGGLAVAAGVAVLASGYFFAREPSGSRVLLAAATILAGGFRVLMSHADRQRAERLAQKRRKQRG